MEVDTGATKSIISERTYRQSWDKDHSPPLRATDAKLRTYTGETINILGSLNVQVSYGGQTVPLELLVVAGSGPSLMGRDWLQTIKLDWAHLHLVHTSTALQDVLDRHTVVFQDKLGMITGASVCIPTDPQVPPTFYKPRLVPYTLRSKVEAELDRLEGEGVLKKVQSADWGAPIVPVAKKDGSVRICGDYKLTMHQQGSQTGPVPSAPHRGHLRITCRR